MDSDRVCPGCSRAGRCAVTFVVSLLCCFYSSSADVCGLWVVIESVRLLWEVVG